MSLVVGAGCCVGHRCDQCADCADGVCCGESMRDDHLPVVGTWTGVTYGTVGALSFIDGRVQCHACGLTFLMLGKHLAAAHGITADEYRAYFGLCAGTGLTSPDTHANRIENGRRRAESGMPGSPLATMTSEQRSIVTYQRERRPERRIRAYASDDQRRKALRRSELLRADPVRRERMAAVIRAARRTNDDGRTCPECGALFCTWTSRSGGSANKATTCLQTGCITSARRRAAQTTSTAAVKIRGMR